MKEARIPIFLDQMRYRQVLFWERLKRCVPNLDAGRHSETGTRAIDKDGTTLGRTFRGVEAKGGREGRRRKETLPEDKLQAQSNKCNLSN